MVLDIIWWASALFATAISFAVSYIFFYKLRTQVAADLAERVSKSKNTDEDFAIEDGEIDSQGNR